MSLKLNDLIYMGLLDIANQLVYLCFTELYTKYKLDLSYSYWVCKPKKKICLRVS
jgi:hypothetical protein